jgi:hypothetical protein
MKWLILLLSWNLFASEFAVVTLVVEEEQARVAQQGLLTKSLYSARYGYRFHLERGCPFNPCFCVWNQVPVLLKLMNNPVCKWIFWSDANSLIMNQNIPLQSLVDDRFCLIISKTKSGKINFGQFLIKNCERSRQFLRAICNPTECIDATWLGNHPEFCKNFVKFIPQSAIHASPSKFRSGDFIIQFDGADCRENLFNFFEFYFTQVLW